MAIPWKIEGTYFEACNCNVACPCVFTSPPTDGNCNVLLGWHIDKGNFGDTRLDDLKVGMFVHAPGHMAQGGWQVAIYVDERANKAQHDALAQIYSGKAGGHFGNVSPLFGKIFDVKSAAIDYREDGKKRSLKIAQLADMEIEAVEGQGGKDITLTNIPLTLVPGFPAVVGKSKQLRYKDHGFNVEISQKNGFYSPFAYQA